MEIKLAGINYTFDADGNITEVIVKFSKFEGTENLTASIAVTTDDVTDFNSVDRTDLEGIARKKLISYIQATGADQTNTAQDSPENTDQPDSAEKA